MELELCSIQSQTDEEIKAGRVKITMSAYEIHDAGNYSQHNKRGLHWEEKYTRENMESAVGAPFVVRFIDDDRSFISDHGRMENDIEDGTIIFPDSDTVGHIEKVWIEEKEIDEKLRKVLMVSGVIYDQRYHELVKYLRTALASKGRVKGSVEICGKGKSPQIVYEHGLGSHDADGNLIVPRTPVQYDISALAILSDFVPPADDGSQVIEINSMKYSRTQINKKDNNKKEESNMAEINTETVIELNTKVATQAAEINNLQHQVNEKDAELNKCKEELNACKEELNAYKKKEEELNKCKEELNSSKNKETELNSLLVEANKTVESQKTQIAELNSEIEPLRQMKADVDSKTAQAEINAYFETIKKENGFSEAELNSLKADFVDKGDLAGLKAKETELCVNKFKELKKIDAANVEINSANNNSNLFFSTKNNAEVNSVIDDGSELFR
jgi:uncharacterized coiled-coil protein SlyX